MKNVLLVLMTSIHAFFQAHLPNGNRIQALPFPTSIKHFKKGDILTRYNQVEKHGYFLMQGISKISMIREGEERILDFFFPGDFFSAYTSFLSQHPSDVECVALSNMEVECIFYTDLQAAYQHSLEANQFGRMVTEQSYIRKTKREKDFLTLSATERYKQLLSERPELIQEIPVHMLAKYLGIHAESLSRIRREIL